MIHLTTFKLMRPTLALDIVDGKQRVVTMPTDAIVTACAGSPDRLGLVNVRWRAKSLAMFAVDLCARGIQLTQPKANGLHAAGL